MMCDPPRRVDKTLRVREAVVQVDASCTAPVFVVFVRSRPDAAIGANI